MELEEDPRYGYQPVEDRRAWRSTEPEQFEDLASSYAPIQKGTRRRSGALSSSGHPLCPEGLPIDSGRRTYAVRMPDGPCENCGAGPLHGPMLHTCRCPCAFPRGGRRVCRECAIAMDLFTLGRTRIICNLTPAQQEYVAQLYARVSRSGSSPRPGTADALQPH